MKITVIGASYVVTQLRVGQMPARVAYEYLGLRHGLIGQETTGIGGMAKALRTIPVILGMEQAGFDGYAVRETRIARAERTSI